ncbi:unnamed protein product [Citrullus colocynthis]|uniref:Uncharacterized protein n=1 Tax=Citrullus colocynthis TaxID=252529 RepID=A0ABP0YFS5_9ROSI
MVWAVVTELDATGVSVPVAPHCAMTVTYEGVASVAGIGDKTAPLKVLLEPPERVCLILETTIDEATMWIDDETDLRGLLIRWKRLSTLDRARRQWAREKYEATLERVEREHRVNCNSKVFTVEQRREKIWKNSNGIHWHPAVVLYTLSFFLLLMIFFAALKNFQTKWLRQRP